MTTAPAALRIGGLTPLTSLDYPGELAAVVFCQGCPWRCRYCHNGHLIAARAVDPIPWGEVMAFLQRRRGLLDAVVFSGGEPTLQAALPAALAEVRALGFKTGLHTAGPYPDRLARALPHLDWVGLDIKALPEDYPTISGVAGSGDRAWASLALSISAGVSLEVRTTPLPGLDDAAYLGRLAQRLAGAGVRDYVLQTCRTGACLNPGLNGRPVAPPPGLEGTRFARFQVRAA
jgi:pyruvate formate lyase activating enzyme